MTPMPSFVELFGFSIHPAEILLRGTAIYWFLFLLFRFVLRRDTGSMAISDILLVVLVADAAQNAMAGDYKSIADGCLLIATLGAWNLVLDWSAYRFAPMRRFVEGAPVQLVRDGRPIKRNMRREMVTMEDLMSTLREHGLDSLAPVRSACMEPDGEISIIKQPTSPEDEDAKKAKKTPGAA
jgi:uncharacterized membrane protein YcaP (DUF421 family)